LPPITSGSNVMRSNGSTLLISDDQNSISGDYSILSERRADPDLYLTHIQ
jgi:hypothetical protein